MVISRDGLGRVLGFLILLVTWVWFRVFLYLLGSLSGQKFPFFSQFWLDLAKNKQYFSKNFNFGLFGFCKILHGLVWVLEKLARVRSVWPKRPRVRF